MPRYIFLPIRKISSAQVFALAPWFFIFIQILIFIALIRSPHTWPWFLWYCNHIPLLYAWAIWKHRPQMMLGLMQVGFLVQLTWILDFSGHFFGTDLVNEANYMFEGELDMLKIAALVAHVAIPIAILSLSAQLTPKKTSLLYAGAYLLSLYAATLLLGPTTDNINCVTSPCTTPFPFTWHYTLLWPLYASLLVLITYSLQCARYAWQHRYDRWPVNDLSFEESQ